MLIRSPLSSVYITVIDKEQRNGTYDAVHDGELSHAALVTAESGIAAQYNGAYLENLILRIEYAENGKCQTD